MRTSDLLHSAVVALSANRARAALTMLGIVIGVASVTLMTGIGASMEGVILGQVSVLGPDSMVIFLGKGPEGGTPQARSGFDSLTFEDVEALQKLTTVTGVAPVILITSKVSSGREEGEPQVIGTTPLYFSDLKLTLARGRLLDDTDLAGAKNVAVIGPDVAADFFPGGDPLGRKLQIMGRSFTVVGLLEAAGSAFFTNLDERVYLPLSVAKSMTGQNYLSVISFRHTGDAELSMADVKALLRQRHRIQNPADDADLDDFIVRSSDQARELFGTVSFGLTAFITLIAAISLVVGGIGIMNIMLVTVTERTREIGLRKALGATPSDILLQFLAEAVALTLTGGCIGVVLGIVFAALISLGVGIVLPEYGFALNGVAIVVAIVMAAFTGLLFGIEPARRASRLNPVEALRYE